MPSGLAAEIVIVGLCLLGAAALPRQIKRRACLAFARLSRQHPVGSPAAIMALVIVVRLCCLPLIPRPTPLIPDEYSYLLLARTLAMGRFANPPHALWQHFETLFILQRPMYASVYPPVQGAILSAGLILSGEPWAGVLASVAGLCFAIAWMLRAYVTRLWALYGGLLAAAGFGAFNYWTNSYWGGAGAALGGALVFGAWPRLFSHHRTRNAAILGFGLLVLANSRPYEGFLAALPVAFCVARYCTRPGAVLRSQVAVLMSVLFAGAIFTCWYNWRVTGSPLRLPHIAYMDQYAAAPAFVWQHPRRAPEYRDRVLRDAHLSFGIDYAEYATVLGTVGMTFKKIARIVTFYWGPLWPLALLAVPEFLREPRFRVVISALALCLVGILLTVGFQVHYAAPCTSIFILMLVDASRRFCKQWKTLGATLVIALPVAWIGVQVLSMRAPRPPNSLLFRHSVEAAVAAQPGRHVIFVYYGPSHPLGEEWVYNEPDIDHSRVIWARDLGQDSNREVFRYYPKRTFWLVKPDQPVPRAIRCTRDCGVARSPVSATGTPGR